MKNSSLSRYIIPVVVLVLISGNMSSAQTKVWSLKDCINRALTENIALNQGVAGSETNRINYEQAKAGRLPNLNFSDGFSLNAGRSLDPVSYRYTHRDISASNISLTTSVTLFAGLKNKYQVKQNGLIYDAGILDVGKLKNDLQLNVTAAYMQVLFAFEAIDIAQSQIAATMEHLQYTEKYVSAGSLPENSLFQMRAQLAGDKVTKITAENDLQIAKVTLMQLIDLPVTAEFETERPDPRLLFPDVTLSTQQIYSIAEGFLPEVKSAAIKTKSAEAGLRVSRSGLFPRLTLSGNIGSSYSSTNSLVTYQTVSQVQHIGYLAGNPAEIVDGVVSNSQASSSYYSYPKQLTDNFGQGVSLSLSVPIFNNLLYRSDIRRSEVAIRIATMNERLVKNQLRKNIELAYTDQRAATNIYLATKDQLAAEESAYRNVTVKFKAGAINTTDFFVEKSMYNKALVTHLQAKYQYLFKTKILNFYLNNPIAD